MGQSLIGSSPKWRLEDRGRAGRAVCMAIVLLAKPISAQIPDTFTNLQHFPTDIAHSRLIDAMRTISLDLGVRCQFCHVGSADGVSFEGVDFASDESPNKRAARYMLGMVDRLNLDISGNLAETPRERNEISCKTCHRGLSRPTLLFQELDRTLTIEGATGLDEAYDRARESIETGRWDFREWEINLFAERLEAAGRVDEAIAVWELNLRHHESSMTILGNLARLYESNDRIDDAIAALRRMLDVDAENAQAAAALARLGGNGLP